MKSVALFDVDNTLYDGFSLYGVLENEVKAGILTPSVLRVCQQVLQDYKNGDADYEASVLKVLKVHAKGLAGQKYDQALELAIDFYKNTKHFYSFAQPVIRLLSTNHDSVLVTAEPGYASESIMKVLGANNSKCTIYEVIDGIFTGNVATALASRHDKHNAIRATMQNYQKQNSFAFGDSEGDIEILKVVEHAICINASDGLKVEAYKHGWRIVEPNDIHELVKSILS